MINLALSSAQQQTFHRLLVSHHRIFIRMQVLTLNHNYVGDVSSRLVDGQITVDADGDVVRTLDADLKDPTYSLHLDSNSPDSGALFADRMIRVYYVVITADGTKEYSVPVFTGPITSLERSGPMIKVECQGKEVFGLYPSWTNKTFKKGLVVTSVIKAILRMMGESRYQIPNLRNKLPRNYSVGADATPWRVAKHLASSLGYQLFFDGRGYAVMRRTPSKSVWTSKEGAGGSVLTEPQAGFDIDNLVNAVDVRGKKPKGAKKHIRVRKVARRDHPLSPWRIGRTTAPSFRPLFIEDDSLATKAAANRRAASALAAGLLESTEVSYDSLVIPHLEELDLLRIQSSQFSAAFRLRKFAIPFNAGGVSSIGYVKRVTVNTKKIRSRRGR